MSREIALISDTHGAIPDDVLTHCMRADEVWHAGDIGDLDSLLILQQKKTIRAVYGNIDDHKTRAAFPLYQVVEAPACKILITHIAGAVGSYSAACVRLIKQHQPDLLICGHSHILKVVRDHRFNLLYMNPGSCGYHGFHRFRTLLLFTLGDRGPENLRAVELGTRSKLV